MTTFEIVPPSEVKAPVRARPVKLKPLSTGETSGRPRTTAVLSMPPVAGVSVTNRAKGFTLPKQPNQPLVQAFLVEQLTNALITAQGHSPQPLKGRLAEQRTQGTEEELSWLAREAETFAGRSFLSAEDLDDKHLVAYIHRLAPFAMAPSASVTYAPPSPQAIPFLLGGMTFSAVENLSLRVMELMQVDSYDLTRTMADALNAVSCGGAHVHEDEVPLTGIAQFYNESDEQYGYRMAARAKRPPAEKDTSSSNGRQDWLVSSMPKGSFQLRLIRGIAHLYQGSVQARVSRIKWRACARTAMVFNGAVSPEMSRNTYLRLRRESDDYAGITKIDDATFNRAVERVFEGKWIDLDPSAEGAHLREDVEIVLARAIIALLHTGRRSLELPCTLTAQALLGASLLTGIPIAQWVRFALGDLERRGETFITAETVEKVIELIEFSELMVYLSEAARVELEQLAKELRLRQENPGVAARFAEKLRKGRHIMWSMRAAEGYHLISAATEDEPAKYTHRPDRMLGPDED